MGSGVGFIIGWYLIVRSVMEFHAFERPTALEASLHGSCYQTDGSFWFKENRDLDWLNQLYRRGSAYVCLSVSHLLCSLLQLTDLDVFVPWLGLLYWTGEGNTEFSGQFGSFLGVSGANLGEWPESWLRVCRVVFSLSIEEYGKLIETTYK